MQTLPKLKRKRLFVMRWIYGQQLVNPKLRMIRKQIDRIKKPFAKGSKFERFAPAVNAFDTFLFVPNHTTKKGAHIRDAVDLKRTMVTVIIALIPALIYGIYNTGYQYYIQTGETFTRCLLYMVRLRFSP